MALAQDIINEALTELSIVRVGAVPSAAQSKHALNRLNAMINSWTAQGVVVDPNIPIPDEFEPTFVSNLAIWLAPSYGVQPSPILAQRAKDTWFSLQAAYITAPKAKFDLALQYLPANRLFFAPNLVAFANAVSSGSVTLTPNTTQTIHDDPRCTPNNLETGEPTQIVFEPQTPDAVAALASMTFIAGNAQFKIKHDANVQQDRTFIYTIY